MHRTILALRLLIAALPIVALLTLIFTPCPVSADDDSATPPSSVAPADPKLPAKVKSEAAAPAPQDDSKAAEEQLPDFVPMPDRWYQDPPPRSSPW